MKTALLAFVLLCTTGMVRAQDHPDRATGSPINIDPHPEAPGIAQIDAVSAFKDKLQGIATQQEESYKKSQTGCVAFLEPYKLQLKAATAKVKDIEAQLGKQESLKEKALVPEPLKERIANSGKAAGILQSAIDLFSSLKTSGEKQSQDLKNLFTEHAKTTLKPLFDHHPAPSPTPSSPPPATAEPVSILLQIATSRKVTKRHGRTMLRGEDALGNQVREAGKDLVSHLRSLDLSWNGVSDAFKSVFPEMHTELQSNEKFEEAAKSAKKKIEEAAKQAEEMIKKLTADEKAAKAQQTSAIQDLKTLSSVCDGYATDNAKRQKTISDVLEKVERFLALSHQYHSRIEQKLQTFEDSARATIESAEGGQ